MKKKIVNNLQIKISIQKSFCAYLAHIPHNTFCFYIVNFQLYTDSPSKFCVFYCKNHLTLLKIISKKNAFEKSKNLSPIFCKTIGSNIFFTLIVNNFGFCFLFCFVLNSRVWIQGNSTLWPMGKNTHLWHLNTLVTSTRNHSIPILPRQGLAKGTLYIQVCWPNNALLWNWKRWTRWCASSKEFLPQAFMCMLPF